MTSLEKPEFTLRVRGRTQHSASAEQITGITGDDAFQKALDIQNHEHPELLIEWAGLDEVAALDVDYHDEFKPTEADLFSMACQLAIRPRKHWRTHGNGWRGIFFAQEPLTAEEQAALAIFQLKDHHVFGRNTGVEIKSQTRHPRFPRDGERAGEVYTERRGDLERARRIYLTGEDPEITIENDEVKQWRHERGMEGGERFDHVFCPSKSPEPNTKAPSVVLEERGVKCWKCNRFWTWASLLYADVKPAVNFLKAMVKNRVHWAQAKYEIGPQYEVAYRAMLKLFHLRGDAKDEEMLKLINKVFFPETKMILVDGAFVKDETFERLKDDVVQGYIRLLPATNYVAEKAGEPPTIETGISPHAELDFRAVNQLEDYGYRSIHVLHGMDIAEQMRPKDGTSGPIAIRPAAPPFVYRRRQPDDDERVRQRLEQCFPSINVQLLKLLVACKGLLQYRANDVPRIYVTGQSGAGKSITLQVAASICCDNVTELYFKDSWERFVRSFADAGLRSTFSFIDEVDKTPLTQTDLKSRFLDFATNKTFHVMYGGGATVKHPPVVYLTGTNLMSYLLDDEQITRRFALVELGSGRLGEPNARSWKETCGCDAINWRAASPENTEVSDILVSQVMWEHFMDDTRVPLFEDLVKYYGFSMMSEHRMDADDALREFYHAIHADDEWTGGRYWKESGWRVYKVADTGRAMTLYREITDDGKDIQPLTAANWTRITDKPGMVFARPRMRGPQIGFRFYQERRGGAGGGAR